jgi:hypothetical protein
VRVPNADWIVQLAPQTQGVLQRRVRRVEVAQQRVQIALPQVDLGDLRRIVVWMQQRDHLVDEALLSLPQAKRLAQPFLTQQQVDAARPATGVRGESSEPRARPLQQFHGLGKLRQDRRPVGGLNGVLGGLVP